MKYPSLPGVPSYRVSFPPLDGGVNAHDAANQIEDNQLSDVKNMWWADGALRTRPGITVDIDSVEEYFWEYYESALGGTYDVMVGGKPGRKFVEITRMYPPKDSEWRYTSTLRSVTFDGVSQRSVISTDWEWSRRFSFLVESCESKWDGCAQNGAIAFLGRSSQNMSLL